MACVSELPTDRSSITGFCRDLSPISPTAYTSGPANAASGTIEDYDHTEDDDMKVFVSRLPKKWDDDTLAEQFAAVFG